MNYYYDKTGDNYGKIEALNTTNDYLDNYVMISPLVSFVGAKFKYIKIVGYYHVDLYHKVNNSYVTITIHVKYIHVEK